MRNNPILGKEVGNMNKTEKNWARSHQTKDYPCVGCGEKMIDVEWALSKGVCPVCKLHKELIQ